MKEAILHISDLHLSSESDVNVNPKRTALLIKLDQLKQEYHFTKLLITGDIADSGLEDEYKLAGTYIKEILGALGLQNKDAILIPGNHDIRRSLLKCHCEDNDVREDEAYRLNDIKQKHFIDFYNEFYGDNYFDHERIVFCEGVLFSKINYLCLNSNYGLGYQDGGIDYDSEQLRTELQELKVQEPVVVLVHNVKTNVRGDASYASNWDDLLYIFNHYKIYSFIGGHIHEKSSKYHWTMLGNGFLTVDKMGKSKHEHKDSSQNGFQIIELLDCDGDFCLLSKPFIFRDKQDGASMRAGLDDDEQGKPFVQCPKDTSKEALDCELPDSENPMSEHYIHGVKAEQHEAKQNDTQMPKDNESALLANNSLSRELLKIIQDNHLLVSGHFHFCKESRVHSIINMERLVADKYALLLIEALFSSMLQKSKIA
jgi:hypothetical protein